MGKIFAPPTEIGKPRVDFKRNWEEQENEYLQKLRTWVKLNRPNKDAGEVISFQVADGYAQYMVLSLKPVELMHIPFGDGYQYQYANRLTAKDIREEIERGKLLAELFNQKS